MPELDQGHLIEFIRHAQDAGREARRRFGPRMPQEGGELGRRDRKPFKSSRVGPDHEKLRPESRLIKIPG